MSRDFVGALLQLNAEKQISREQLIGAVEDGIQSAYRRVAGDEDIHVRIDAETGKIRVFRARRVVGEIEDEFTEMTIEQAHAIEPDADLGDLVETEQLDGDVFGRIGAQTAKQIVLQRIREVERDQVFDQFASREGELMTGTVNRVEPRAIILDVGKNVEAILATTEQSTLEHYRIGQNVKAFVLEVRRSTKGPQIFVSRTHKGFLKRLFELEVPEIHSGTVEIKAIAREAGSRSKVAVASRQDGLDPVGATVGQRGARVQAVVAELSGEKIDVIPWSDDASVFVANALSPAQVISVDIDEEHRIASVTVPERMLSLAIGREGQNARLAARLTGWRIDIRSDVSVAEAKAAADAAHRARALPRRRSKDPRREAVAATTVAKPKRADGRCRTEADGGRAGRRGCEAPAAKPKRVDEEGGGRAPKPCRASRRGRSRAATTLPPPEAAEPETAPARQAEARRRRRRAAVPIRGGGVVGRAARTVAPRRVPNRTCVACRTVRPKRELHAHRADPGRRRHPRRDRSCGRPRRLRLPDRASASTKPSPRAPSAGRSRPRSRRPARRARREHHRTPNTIIEGGARGQE